MGSGRYRYRRTICAEQGLRYRQGVADKGQEGELLKELTVGPITKTQHLNQDPLKGGQGVCMAIWGRATQQVYFSLSLKIKHDY